MDRRFFVIFGLAAVLAGYQHDAANAQSVILAQAAPSVGAGASAAVDFRCPAAGTRITLTTGTVLAHEGPDPADPAVCRARNTAGNQLRLLYNWYGLPTNDEASLRRGFGGLWPLSIGKTASFVFIGTSSPGNTFQFLENWRVERTERLNVAGAFRETVVLSRTQEGRLGNTHRSRTTIWLDLATRAWVKQQVELFSGTTGARPYEAERIDLPR